MATMKLHYLHSRNGRFADTTDHNAADVDLILDSLAASRKKRLVLHFHGGLVSKEKGLEITERLLPVYDPAAYSLFFVWESSAWETIRNNLKDIAKEKAFRALVRKLLEYTLRKVGLEDGKRSINGSDIRKHEVKDRLDAWFDSPQTQPVPYSEAHPKLNQDETRSAARSIGADAADINEILADIENDWDFQDAMSTLTSGPQDARDANIAPVPVHSTQMDKEIVREFTRKFDVAFNGADRGAVSLILVARHLANLLAAVIGRFADGRDHGFYVTVVEEILRALYGGAIGKTLFWNQMKKDTGDAFKPHTDMYVGTALLSRLKQRLAAGLLLEKVFLVGHSTGGIYISRLLEASEKLGMPADLKFDIVLLAPANDYESFEKMLNRHSNRIASLRLFGMQDAVERNDGLLGDDIRRAIYPYSLLYFVSGLLEQEADMPLVGMHRFFANKNIFNAHAFPAVAKVRDWLASQADRLVWAEADDGDGRRCLARKHGDFDNDPVTLNSLAWIVSH